VPAGFWHDHEVHTLESYPYLTLGKLKDQYPYAVINVIVTAIGGENSLKGQKRFETEVLNHKPDVLMIDYALNDRFSDINAVKEAANYSGSELSNYVRFLAKQKYKSLYKDTDISKPNICNGLDRILINRIQTLETPKENIIIKIKE
jgi:hypothetical protein